MHWPILRSITLLVLVSALSAECCWAEVVYLALGDSVTSGISSAIGEDPNTPASYGDQGFVANFADRLTSLNGGVRPTVVNLAVYGETSGSFVTGTVPVGWTKRITGLNSNYTSPSDTQLSLMVSQINAIHGAGKTVGYATFMVGANDIFYATATPAFANGTPAEQQQLIADTIAAVQGNYLTVLGTLTALAPEARILLPTDYNAYPAGYEPQHSLYNSILTGFRQYVQADADAFGATMIDLSPLFAGNELTLTNIGIGDILPKPAGYEVIGGALVSAVPEPSGIMAAAIGLACLAGCNWRRRTARSRTIHH